MMKLSYRLSTVITSMEMRQHINTKASMLNMWNLGQILKLLKRKLLNLMHPLSTKITSLLFVFNPVCGHLNSTKRSFEISGGFLFLIRQ